MVERSAPADLATLGWDTDAHVELLWSLSRAPDADVALHTMVRLAEALGSDWQQLNAALLKDRGLRGRLFSVIGSSLALGDHLVANPLSWHLLEGAVTLPDAGQLRQMFDACIAEFGTAAATIMPKLRTLYRDQLLILAALDTAPTVENELIILKESVAGDFVVTERLDRHRLPDRWVELPVCGLWEIRDGRIAAWREYFDLQTLFRQWPELKG